MLRLLTPRLWYEKLPRDYWHVREPMGKHIATDGLGGYPIDMRGKTSKYRGQLHDGFPLRDQNREGLQLLPVTVTQMALGHYDCWLEDQRQERVDAIRRSADWLTKQHGPCEGKLDGWSYWFDHGRLGIKAPFISAMGQGQGISLLVRAHKIIGDERYLETAKLAFKPFLHAVGEGGVTAFMANGDVFFEEYPCQPYSHIFNGHVFALWGVYDYATYLNDQTAHQLASSGRATLIKMLPRYDLQYWSRYGLFPHPRPNVASPFYHELHIAQLHALYALFGDNAFAEYAARWESQFDNWLNCLRAVYEKIRFKKWVRETKKRLRSDGIEVDAAEQTWTAS